ncbi:hypothetical protein P6B95_05835 [Streptomyces atratus]|uniref:hypothetical protein n=1 Tax=Streptomyces atratus TaxID=1893 RepID=UPI002AC34C27|nr:hypothetical protein [Streptomyces atratus]WPW26970.1 hypothetical protein P6B95_05835 [Streptomyces atratus]
MLLGEGIGVLDLAPSPGTVRALAEVTLVWVLFADAARLSSGPCSLSSVCVYDFCCSGLPVCAGLGTLPAMALLPGVSGWAALYVAPAHGSSFRDLSHPLTAVRAASPGRSTR